VIRYRFVLSCAVFGAFAPTAFAQDCIPPSGFAEPAGSGVTVAWTGTAGLPCSLRAELSSDTAQRLMAGFAVHPLIDEPSPLRLRVTIDYSELLPLTSLIRSASFVSVAGTTAPAGSSAQVLRLGLAGASGGGSNLQLSYPDATASLGYGSTLVPLDTVTGSMQIGIELQLGSAGYVHYWINTAFYAPPTGRIPATGYLDFSARGPATGLSMGLFSTSNTFRTTYASKAIVLSDIAVGDYLFRSHFE
jgi:hypothetical protein